MWKLGVGSGFSCEWQKPNYFSSHHQPLYQQETGIGSGAGTQTQALWQGMWPSQAVSELLCQTPVPRLSILLCFSKSYLLEFICLKFINIMKLVSIMKFFHFWYWLFKAFFSFLKPTVFYDFFFPYRINNFSSRRFLISGLVWWPSS